MANIVPERVTSETGTQGFQDAAHPRPFILALSIVKDETV